MKVALIPPALLVLLSLHSTALAQSRLKPTACADAMQLHLPNTAIVSAESVPAGNFTAPDNGIYYVNAFCRVRGVSKPTFDSSINFEVWMPASGWNGRYYQHGQGGGGGDINYAALAGFVNEGVAAGATDNGHQRDDAFSYDWAYGHPQRIIDFGYRSLQVTRDNAQKIISKRYGTPPHHYYFAGCSGGGAEALMAAQRFPQKWDGILAGAPDQDAIGFFTSSAWQAYQWLTRPEGRIPPTKLPVIQRAALASCNAGAHVDGGIAADPRSCPFDPETLLCKGAEENECLTAAQVTTLRNIYEGPRNRSTGQVLYKGFPATMEEAWAPSITGGIAHPNFIYEKTEPAAVHFAMKFFRAFVFENRQWDLRSLDLERDIERAMQKKVAGETLASAQNANQTDLSELRDRGAKMILYVGWGDSSVSPLEIISYYDDVARRMGGAQAAAKFLHLFVVPGMLHCSGGLGADAFGQMPSAFLAPELQNDAEHNLMRALESWVEKGTVPDHLIATKYVGSDPARGIVETRPLCTYPLVPVYRGSGSKDLAENFSCLSDGG